MTLRGMVTAGSLSPRIGSDRPAGATDKPGIRGSSDRRLPDFLGIGVSRCGTTWLHELLASHPDVYLPERRKEISFFDRFFDRGLEWYGSFFPPLPEGARYKRVGEVSPRYIDSEEILRRVASYRGADRYIMMVRHPLRRLVSAYYWRLRNRDYRKSLRELIAEESIHVQRSCFGMHVERFSELMDRSRLLVLVLEEVSADPAAAVAEVAGFLNIDPSRFPVDAGRMSVNANTVPRSRWIYAAVQSFRRKLVAADMDWLVNLTKRTGLRPVLLSRETAEQAGTVAEHADLMEFFWPDIERLEHWLGRPISAWRS